MSSKKLRSRSKLHRRVAALLALAFALIGTGALYTFMVPAPQTAQANHESIAVRDGQQVYNNTCITCHGANLEGVPGRGPSLIGVGEAAVFFQTSTGRMPAVQQGAQIDAKPRVLNDDEVQQLMAFVQSKGGGPALPKDIKEEDQSKANPARGGQLFRLNCASCHNFTGRGGPLSAGKFAPALDDATPEVMYAAMLSGPQNMPKFSDRQLSPQEKKDIIAFVQSVTNGNNNPGGDPIGGLGPQSEGLIAFVVGMAALLGITLWIGAKA